MLKRYQILLTDWQGEHYKLTAKTYDVSFSEMIRMALCLDIVQATKTAFPNYKLKVDEKMLKNIIKKRNRINADSEEFHKFLSKFYFEARKAVEHWRKELSKK